MQQASQMLYSSSSHAYTGALQTNHVPTGHAATQPLDMGKYTMVPSTLSLGSAENALQAYIHSSTVPAAAAGDLFMQQQEQQKQHEGKQQDEQQAAFGEGLLYAWVQEQQLREHAQQLHGHPEHLQEHPEQPGSHPDAPGPHSLQDAQLLEEAPQGTAPTGRHPQLHAVAEHVATPQHQGLQESQACSSCGGADPLLVQQEESRNPDGEVLLIPSRSGHLHEMGARLLTGLGHSEGRSYHAYQARTVCLPEQEGSSL